MGVEGEGLGASVCLPWATFFLILRWRVFRQKKDRSSPSFLLLSSRQALPLQQLQRQALTPLLGWQAGRQAWGPPETPRRF